MPIIIFGILFTCFIVLLLAGIYGFIMLIHGPLHRSDKADHEIKLLYGIDFTKL
jgi:hypothetical protein